jgi:acyl-coenzyme A thioesterase 13
MKGGLEVLEKHIGGEFLSSPSPFMLWLKPTVLEVERGRLVFRYMVRKEMTNPMKGLHGGVTAAIIYDIIGATMITFEEDYFYSTLNNVIDYFAPAYENNILLAETKVIKKGRQLVNVQCEIWNEAKTRLIARGYSNLLKTALRKKQ